MAFWIIVGIIWLIGLIITIYFVYKIIRGLEILLLSSRCRTCFRILYKSVDTRVETCPYCLDPDPLQEWDFEDQKGKSLMAVLLAFWLFFGLIAIPIREYVNSIIPHL